MFLRSSNRETAKPVAPGAAANLQPTATFGAGAETIGEIFCPGVLAIFGRVEGTVRGRGVIVAGGGRVIGTIDCELVRIDEGAFVEGTVTGDAAYVAGALKGLIEARDIAVGATAHIVGTVAHASLTVEQGSVIEGLRPWRPPNYWK
jgi:cytoskeletal protein CcmA (bactofilin family)